MLQKKDLLSLEGKVAVISGAASGIGLAAAQLLSAYGAKVAMIDVNPKGEEEAETIYKEGRTAKHYKCDVTNEENVKKSVGEIKKDFGKIDILFNNAGVTVRKTVVGLEEKEWDFVLDVGLKGTFLLSK
ncbi:MAG TPA: SDR family NAD(P)-dependent oxidoreductase, partial [Clostridia bacterium]|nr:SDR family NAD(P)-dependent oxidoreductase [Clostridia bacterium]